MSTSQGNGAPSGGVHHLGGRAPEPETTAGLEVFCWSIDGARIWLLFCSKSHASWLTKGLVRSYFYHHSKRMHRPPEHETDIRLQE